MTDLKEIALLKLTERGVSVKAIADLVLELQIKYTPTLTLAQCEETVLCVIAKREVVHAILTGIALDEAVEKRVLDQEIEDIIEADESLYGIDEILALSIVNVYGSIALTNFGYLDKVKPGIIGVIDALGKEPGHCHTFLDDIVSALVAASVSRIAHKEKQA